MKCGLGEDLYSLNDLNCKKCPNNEVITKCSEGYVLFLNQGYWRVNNYSDIIEPCNNRKENCLGGNSNNTCLEGHIGALCE